PRWSVVRLAGLEPLSMSGLVACSAIVWVGPPLLARPAAAKSGSAPTGELLPASVIVAPNWLRIRLKLAMTRPRTSAARVFVLFATTVRMRDVIAVATVASPPPPTLTPVPLALLLAIVQFWTISAILPGPAASAMPPPLTPAVLPEIVQFRTVSVTIPEALYR